MRIAILSDIHDHIPNLRAALSRLEGVEALICCGDLCSPFIVNELAAGFQGAIHIVFGNNDGDRYRITLNALSRRDTIQVHGESASLLLGGKRIYVHHFDDVGRLVAAAGEHAVVCYGHNHEYELSRGREGAALQINPGTILGWHPRKGDVPATYALYDVVTGEATIFDLEGKAIQVMR